MKPTTRMGSSARSSHLTVPYLLALSAAATLAGCAAPLAPISGPPAALVAPPPPGQTPSPALPTTAQPDITNRAPGTYAVVNGEPVAIPSIPMGDPATIRRIIEEGTQRNRVMDHLTHLCTVIGPRLTASSACEAANRWTMEQFRAWGLSAEMVEWGQAATRFDRSPSRGVVFKKARTPGPRDRTEDVSNQPPENWTVTRELQFTTLAWTSGTRGPSRGNVLRMPETEEEYAKVRDSLQGAWILIKPTPLGGRAGVRAGGQRAGDRFTARLEARKKVAEGARPADLPIDERVIFDNVAGFISAPMDERDRVWTTAAPGWRDRPAAEIPPDVEVIVRLSDYDYLNSRLADGDEFQVEFDLPHTITAGPIPLYNTIAEIRGSELPDEYVYVMGHLDSWNGPGSQGTLDNGTGSSTTLEAARLLMAAGARPKRTIRFALWTGEEQGLLGARAYIKANTDILPRISAALNDDGGTNYCGGLKGNNAMTDTLAAASAPVNGWFIDSISKRPMVVNIQPQARFPRFGGSDHFAFVEADVPGFFWDEVGRQDYGWSWHTQHDHIEYAIPEYLMQSATAAAITAYNLASAPDLLPRLSLEPAAGSADAAPTTPSPTSTAAR